MGKSGVICRIEADRYYILSPKGQVLMRMGKPSAGRDLGSYVTLAPAGRKWKRVLAIAAALALLAVSTIYTLPRASASQYRLALDINPSLELVYTENYQLKEWTAFDQAGTELLSSLERPEDVYAAIEAIFARCVQLGLTEEEQNVFVTADSQAPIDSDRLLGAFEGQGVIVKLHVVRLGAKEYKADGKSPLRSYLKRKTGTEVGNAESVSAAALGNLQEELAETIDIAPWHDNPVVQAFLEKYLVSGSLVEEMLAEGLTSEEIDCLLAIADAEKLAPADLFKALRQSGQSPGQFLKKHKKPDEVEAPQLSKPDWLPDLLAEEFDHPAGQLSSYLRKGLAPDDLLALLVLEDLGGGKLQKLVRGLETASVEALVSAAGIDAVGFEERLNGCKSLQSRAGKYADMAEVAELAASEKVSEGEILYILGRGYGLEEAGEILVNKLPNQGWKEFLDNYADNPGDGKNKGPGKGK